MELIGFPDPELLAKDMASHGHYSCAEAEDAGWLLTEHEPLRQILDAILARIRPVTTTPDGSTPEGS